MNKPIIVLTANIIPNSNAGFLVDPQIRKEQYINALAWYLENTNYDIIWIENSNSSIKDDIKESYHKKVEFLVFDDPAEEIDRSKGYKEIKMMEYACMNSEKLKDADLVIKITGRLICLNIVDIVKKIEKQAKFSNSFFSCTVNIRQTYTDSRIFSFNKNIFSTVIKYGDLVTSTCGLEDALLILVKNSKKENLDFHYQPLPPRFKGINGGFGYEWKNNWFNYIYDLFKHELKKISFKIRKNKLKGVDI